MIETETTTILPREGERAAVSAAGARCLLAVCRMAVDYHMAKYLCQSKKIQLSMLSELGHFSFVMKV